MLSADERIAAALAVLDKPRAHVADLAAVNEAVEILRGGAATHCQPLAVEEDVEPTLGDQKGPAPG